MPRSSQRRTMNVVAGGVGCFISGDVSLNSVAHKPSPSGKEDHVNGDYGQEERHAEPEPWPSRLRRIAVPTMAMRTIKLRTFASGKAERGMPTERIPSAPDDNGYRGQGLACSTVAPARMVVVTAAHGR